jgi:transcriptional regulator with XRE-family HTH domain
MTKSKPSPLDIEIGRRLRHARKKEGYSQELLGAALGVSFQQIQKYENGKSRLSASGLLVAARFLGIDPSELQADPSHSLSDNDLRGTVP